MFVLHPTKEVGTEAPKNIQNDNLYKSESGYFEYLYEGTDLKKMVFITNKETGWKIAGTMYSSEVDQEASPILDNTLLVLCLAYIIGGVIVYMIKVESMTAAVGLSSCQIQQIQFLYDCKNDTLALSRLEHSFAGESRGADVDEQPCELVYLDPASTDVRTDEEIHLHIEGICSQKVYRIITKQQKKRHFPTRERLAFFSCNHSIMA